jgi:hypothetical protein
MWRYAASRATGASHQRSGIACQDRFACAEVANDIFAFVIADGAGSASMCEAGAGLAVETIIRAISSELHAGQTDMQELLRSAVAEAQIAVGAEAEGEGLSSNEFATTLLAVVVGPSGGAAVQIGDGVIVVRDEEGAWCWMFWPQHGEFVNTTRFLTDDDAMERMEIGSLPGGVTDVVLMSDGLERLSLDIGRKEAHSPFFTGLIGPLSLSEGQGEVVDLSSQLELFLCSERVRSRTDDDVSLIMATRSISKSNDEEPASDKSSD